jgi:hypothetical protein
LRERAFWWVSILSAMAIGSLQSADKVSHVWCAAARFVFVRPNPQSEHPAELFRELPFLFCKFRRYLSL